MLSKLATSWGPQLLEFVEELPKETNSFPKYVLKLLSKHFGFNRMLIFPYAYRTIDLEKRSKRDALSNFVTLNIESSLMKEYGATVSNFDIFVPKRLPEHLKNRKVLFTRDVMPYEKYRKTEYYAYMVQQDMDNQACIYLIYKNEIIGNICIFRSSKEPDFTEEERVLMEYLSVIISNQYVTSLHRAGDVLSQEGFELLFRNSKVGAVMLSSRMTVLLANSTSQEHYNVFIKNFGMTVGHAFRSSYQRSSRYDNIQQVIDSIGLDLINNDAGRLTHTSLQEEFRFMCSPIIFINIYGDVETRHLILSSWFIKKLNNEFQNIFGTLTQREYEILGYILSGSTNKEIMEKLHVSIFTVRTHISNIYRKFDVNSRAELLLKTKNTMDFDDMD